MSATKEHLHDQIEAGQRGKQHPIGWLNMPGYKPETWNPIVGCTKVSPGCDNCYAERMAFRIANMQLKNHGKNGYHYTEVSKLTSIGWTGETRLINEALRKPLAWREPRMIFVCSMSDLFHESVPFEWIDEVFIKVSVTHPKHLFIILTKRPQRMAEYFNRPESKILTSFKGKPLQNFWIGVTAENQEQANKRIPILLQIPAAKRFVSIEPMLGPVKLNSLIREDGSNAWVDDCLTGFKAHGAGGWYANKLDWVICGGESGPKARPMHPDWVRSLRDQCASANVPFFFKQWGEWQSYWFNMTSKEVCFKMYSSYLQFTQKDWVNKGDACISLDGKLCKTGGDMQQAQYPVAIMQRLGRKNTGNMIDGERHQNWPIINL